MTFIDADKEQEESFQEWLERWKRETPQVPVADVLEVD